MILLAYFAAGATIGATLTYAAYLLKRARCGLTKPALPPPPRLSGAGSVSPYSWYSWSADEELVMALWREELAELPETRERTG